jgi:hypothetical protein
MQHIAMHNTVPLDRAVEIAGVGVGTRSSIVLLPIPP